MLSSFSEGDTPRRLWIIPQAIGMDMDMLVVLRRLCMFDLRVRVDLRVRIKFNFGSTL